MSNWTFTHIGLIVTGVGEREFLPKLLRSLTASGDCTIEVIAKIGQRSPITSSRRKISMVGTGKIIPDRDQNQIGLPARRYLSDPKHKSSLVIVVDDLEAPRKPERYAVFERYRIALDTMLGSLKERASVHFLVNMLEAYFFAHAVAVNSVLKTSLADHPGDVEDIPNPKVLLKSLFSMFDEVSHGEKIAGQIDLEHVLNRVDTCASLRTLVTWIEGRLNHDLSNRFQLTTGILCTTTGVQIRYA